MFLRKLTVIVVPLLLMLALALLLPLMNGWGFLSLVVEGLLLGMVLALLLPLSGASRKKEPFAHLLWIPTVILTLIVAYQHLASLGKVAIPILSMLTTANAQVVLSECALIGFMLLTTLRTRS